MVISGRRVAEGEKLAKEITSGGGSALFVRTDVAREDDIVALVEKTVGTFGALHIAFNNAGTEGQFGLLTTEQTVEHYHQVCDINIRGVLLSMKHEIPAMLRSGGGAIVNNSSVGGHIGFPGSSVYVASKFAVIGLTKTAALEFAKQGEDCDEHHSKTCILCAQYSGEPRNPESLEVEGPYTSSSVTSG